MSIKIYYHNPVEVLTRSTCTFVGDAWILTCQVCIRKQFYLDILRRRNAKWTQREISAKAQNPPPLSAVQWWKPPPMFIAHPRSIASLAARIVPPTCHTPTRLCNHSTNIDKSKECKEHKMNLFYLLSEWIKNFLLHKKIWKKRNWWNLYFLFTHESVKKL